jgi:hypothetical protein
VRGARVWRRVGHAAAARPAAARRRRPPLPAARRRTPPHAARRRSPHARPLLPFSRLPDIAFTHVLSAAPPPSAACARGFQASLRCNMPGKKFTLWKPTILCYARRALLSESLAVSCKVLPISDPKQILNLSPPASLLSPLPSPLLPSPLLSCSGPFKMGLACFSQSSLSSLGR